MKQACEVDHVKVQQYEDNNGIVWGTFQHCVECLYEPHCMVFNAASADASRASIIESLQNHAIDVLLQHLLNSLGRREHVEVVVAEDIFDYITLLPWILPHNLREKAWCVYGELTKFRQIQPSSLATLTKASLAKTTWGLQRLISMNAISDLYTVSQ